MYNALTVFIWTCTVFLMGGGLWLLWNIVHTAFKQILDEKNDRRMQREDAWWRNSRDSLSRVITKCHIANWDDLTSGEQHVLVTLKKRMRD